MAYGPYTSQTTAQGGVLQAGLYKSYDHGIRHSAYLVRGVVTATYVADDPGHPYFGNGPIGIYCDVLCYTSIKGGRVYPLYAVLVSQDASSAQEGRVWKPRATTQDLSGNTLDAGTTMDFTSWDGDHVLMGFIDDDRTLPVILRCLPHPRVDIGIAGSQPAGQRIKLTLADGRPSLTKHHGSVMGVDKDGNVLLDASRGTGQETLPGGAQAPPATGSITARAHAAGSHTRELVLPAGPVDTPVARETFSAAGLAITFITGPGGFSIAGVAGPLLALAAPGGLSPASLKLGGGGAQAADANKVALALNALIGVFNSHTHVCAAPGSPSLLPVPLAPTLPVAPLPNPLGISSLSLPP